jgi:hypothetical protein
MHDAGNRPSHTRPSSQAVRQLIFKTRTRTGVHREGEDGSWNTNEYHIFGFWRSFSLSYARHPSSGPAVKYNLISPYRLGYLRSMAFTRRVFFFHH